MFRLHLSLKAFESPLLLKVFKTMHEVCHHVEGHKKHNVFFKVIGLPTLRKYITVLRSPHVHKKSREQFIIKQHKALLRLDESLGACFQWRVSFASKHMTLAGVQVKQITEYSTSLWSS